MTNKTAKPFLNPELAALYPIIGDNDEDLALDACEHDDAFTFAVNGGSLPPAFGLDSNPSHGVIEYVAWWSDGEDSRYCDN